MATILQHAVWSKFTSHNRTCRVVAKNNIILIPVANFKFKSAFRFPELAGLAGQSVNLMRHFEGMVLQNLEKIINPKMVRIFL